MGIDLNLIKNIMTPKEKSEDLIIKYLTVSSKNNYNMSYTIAKQCALIAVDELIDEQTSWQNGQVNPVLYWQEVKQEIKNF